jgi:hypothetical protein
MNGLAVGAVISVGAPPRAEENPARGHAPKRVKRDRWVSSSALATSERVVKSARRHFGRGSSYIDEMGGPYRHR